VPSPRLTLLRAVPAAVAAALLLLLGACGGATPEDVATAGPGPVDLRLGYFPNVTHAPAIVGLQEGLFQEALGDGVALDTTTFNAGTEAVTALFSGALDATYIGPGPAVNAWQQSGGEAIRIIAGAASGGAALVVREGIEGPEDLVGATIASPSLGNTQDIALRAWLADNGLEADLEGGGEVQVLPQANAQSLETFRSGDIDGAWVPEPWASRLVLEGGGTVLVDERDLWPDGQFVTTHLIVATAFLEEHPDVVADLLRGHVAAVDRIEEDPEAAQVTTNDGIDAAIGERLPDETIAAAWGSLTFTLDPIAGSLEGGAEDAVEAGLLEEVDLRGIYDLGPLNDVLAEDGRDAVDDGGLGAAA
jgi:NitT/TauT family transport system substrate-binding protein